MAGKRRIGSLERIGRLISSEFEGTTLGARLKDLAVWQIWGQVVGPAIAARTKPLRFSGGQLTVLVSGAPWMQQLNFLKEELRSKLNQRLGDERITAIVFKAGSVHERSPSAADHPPEPVLHPLSPDCQQRIDRQVRELDDPELAALLKQLMEQHYRRHPDDTTSLS